MHVGEMDNGYTATRRRSWLVNCQSTRRPRSGQGYDYRYVFAEVGHTDGTVINQTLPEAWVALAGIFSKMVWPGSHQTAAVVAIPRDGMHTCSRSQWQPGFTRSRRSG
jgi:hypothetical protein